MVGGWGAVVVAVVVVDVCGSGSVHVLTDINPGNTVRFVSKGLRDRRGISALIWHVGAPESDLARGV